MMMMMMVEMALNKSLIYVTVGLQPQTYQLLVPVVGQWLVVQQRLDANLSFDQAWNSYKNGLKPSHSQRTQYTQISQDTRCCGDRFPGPDRRNWSTPPSVVALALRNGLEDQNGDAKRLNGDASCTLLRNLISFRRVISEFTRLDCVQQASKMLDIVSIRSLGVRTARKWSINTRLCFCTVRWRPALLGRAFSNIFFHIYASCFSTML